MPAIEMTFIRSQVARRAATLFVLCGVVPLLGLALVTSWRLERYLIDLEKARLRAMAKDTVMVSVGQLLETEARLRLLGAQRGRVHSEDLPGVVALLHMNRDERTTPLIGRLSAPVWDARVATRLAAGRAALVLPQQAFGSLYLIVPDADGGRWVAAIDPRVVWALDERASDGRLTHSVCGATDRGVLLACSDQETLPDLTKTWVHAWNGAGSFETNEWLGAYWSGPLEAHYGVPGWTAVIVTRSSEALAPARTVMRTFGLALLATLCAVTLVVFQQLRRLLDPVGQLKEGTARLAQGQFDTRVAVATGDEFQDLGESFNTMAGELQRTFQQLHELSEGTLEALARAIDAKSAWTAGHSSRVTSVAVAIARALGYDTHAQERIRRGGLLHDIGKIGIAANILDKPDSLTKAEMAIMREHPTTGARILQPLPHCAEILPMVLQHHERLDGSGYPAGLRGSGIALDARILAVADVYDAMTSDRPYRKGLPATEASAYIVEHAGTRFDPAVVTAFLTAMSGPGQLMAAEDGALARTA